MYPDINININLPSGFADAAQVAQDISAIGPPPEESMTQTGGAEMNAEAAVEMPPGPEEATMGDAGNAIMQAAPPPDEFFHGGMSDISSGGMNVEPPGPEASDAPQMPDAEDKAAIKKPRAKGEKP